MKDNCDLKNMRQKPKRKNSRAKGHSFERKIAAALNNRLNTTEFSRTPGSGAFASTHTLPPHLKIYGDLITPEKFRYCIECKKGYNSINLYSLYNNSSDLWGFFRQTAKDSKKCDRIPMLILKQDRKPILAAIPSYKISNLIEGISYIEASYSAGRWHMPNRWRIYEFAKLLELEDKIWLEQEPKKDTHGF